MADDDNLLVTISGPAFSMMLYENTRIHDQIGFLLGEILVYVSTKVTDSDNDVEQSKVQINIKNVVSYPLGEAFFNSSGQIEEDKLRELLGDSFQNIVGWYHYRKNLPLNTSLRDECIHNNLLQLVSKDNLLMNKENFMFCLLNSSVNETHGTHKFKHLLQHKPNKVFKPIPLKITNLGADATRPDGSDHKPVPKHSSCESDLFDKVYESVKSKLSRTSGVQSVTIIEKEAERFLCKLSPDISKTDKEVSELEKEVVLLRNKIYQAPIKGFAPLEERMQRMEVDLKSSIKSRSRSSSPEIFDDPRISVPSTSRSTIHSQPNIMLDSSSNLRSRRISSERESQDFTLITDSPTSDSSLTQ